MNILDGVKNFLQICNDNWTTMLIIMGLCVALYQKIKSYLQLSNDEKIKIAKQQISEGMLKMIADAEEDYLHLDKAGEIKRSEVIARIYEEYPILSNVLNQQELIKWIDEQIDAALPTLREIWEKQ